MDLFAIKPIGYVALGLKAPSAVGKFVTKALVTQSGTAAEATINIGLLTGNIKNMTPESGSRGKTNSSATGSTDTDNEESNID